MIWTLSRHLCAQQTLCPGHHIASHFWTTTLPLTCHIASHHGSCPIRNKECPCPAHCQLQCWSACGSQSWRAENGKIWMWMSRPANETRGQLMTAMMLLLMLPLLWRRQMMDRKEGRKERRGREQRKWGEKGKTSIYFIFFILFSWIKNKILFITYFFINKFKRLFRKTNKKAHSK